jgi:hypothetical protein
VIQSVTIADAKGADGKGADSKGKP